LTISVGDPFPLAKAHAPYFASAHALLLPPHSLLPSEEDIEGLRLSFGSIGSSGGLPLTLALVGPDAH